MNRIAAVVTTFNRLPLLKENIESLLSQSFSKLDIIIVNNNSTDGTEEYVLSLNNDKIKYYNTGANLGGAGGFAFGVKKALQLGYDYAWLMDDDTIPDNTALEFLIKSAQHLNNKFSFLASTVYWTDGTLFPMNTPTPANDFKMDIENTRDYGLVKLVTCSFVGCFVNLDYAEQVGLPYAEYFIYGDDVEYTTRLSEKESAYWVLKSTLIHKAPSKAGSNVVDASADRIDRFYNQARNRIHLHRMHGGMLHYLIDSVLRRIKNIIMKSPDHKFKRIKMVLLGTVSGLFFNPKTIYIKKNEEDCNEKNLVEEEKADV